ncbi:MAG: undecaprenyl-diphosphate phosphatase [Proteobacteria bacterium]|nr:undecaprenyl-diphosphate phosphatase [Pseudomonadota bacterium]
MGLLQAVILALVQGVTEFLPISSSAHLILVPYAADWPDQGLAFDVALNTATWLAVVLYFRADLARLARGFVRSIALKSLEGNASGRLAWMLLIATIPVAVAGLVAHDAVSNSLRSLTVIGWASILWGLLLYVSDKWSDKWADMWAGRRVDPADPGRVESGEVLEITWRTVIVVGFAQALALIPGTSRSGITITAGLFMGLNRTSAARFSFLLAVVVGALAGASEGVGLAGAATPIELQPLIVAFCVAFGSAYLTIHLFLQLISSVSMTPFVIYRVLLGLFLLSLA